MLDSIRELLERQPFQPFRIVLTSGHKHQVKHPDLLVVMQTQLFLAEPKSDRFHLLRSNQIAAVEARTNAK